MTAITCAKCARRFTPTSAVIEAAVAASQGQKHAQIICPHCGKGNKVALERLKPLVHRTTPAAATQAPGESVAAGGAEAAAPPDAEATGA